MVFLAFIPLVGISIVYIPACLYLFIIGKNDRINRSISLLHRHFIDRGELVLNQNL